MKVIMPEGQYPGFEEAFGALRQFAAGRRATSRPVEHCEMCSAALEKEHPHLVALASRQIVCACTACALLFDGIQGAKYKRVSRRLRPVADFQMTDAQWESLMIPINMAFFLESSVEGRVIALYPSPAGAVESLLPLDAWSEIVEQNPAVRRLESDVEALLVSRVGYAHGAAAAEYYLAPLDECYRLVGLIRSNWRGLSGGTEVWTEVAGFFSDLRSRADRIPGGSNA